MAPLGYSWRSAKWFIITCITIALFSENFLYSYIVPILPVMLTERLHIDPSEVQYTTSLVLSTNAFVSLLTAIPTGYLADKIPSRQVSLLASLGLEAIGTLVIVFATNIPLLLVGRSIQAVGGNAAWIVGIATISDAVGQENTGKTMGVVSSFFLSGLLFGPMFSGTLLGLVGYWPTWMFAIAVLVIDMLLRVVMIEGRPAGKKRPVSVQSEESDECYLEYDIYEHTNEQTALLSSSSGESSNLKDSQESPVYENFFKVILSNPRALTALLCHFTTSIVLVSFDTTLPLHVNDEFGWGTAQVSLVFMILQLPSLLLSSLVGALKDIVGPRLPAGVGFSLTAIFLVLMGIPSRRSGYTGYIIYMAATGGVGVARAFTGGCSTIEMTDLMKELEEERPGRFGPNGKLSSGYSMTNFCWALGKLIGPIVTGFMIKVAGYLYMNIALGMLCFVTSVLSFVFLGRGWISY